MLSPAANNKDNNNTTSTSTTATTALRWRAHRITKEANIHATLNEDSFVFVDPDFTDDGKDSKSSSSWRRRIRMGSCFNKTFKYWKSSMLCLGFICTFLSLLSTQAWYMPLIVVGQIAVYLIIIIQNCILRRIAKYDVLIQHQDRLRQQTVRLFQINEAWTRKLVHQTQDSDVVDEIHEIQGKLSHLTINSGGDNNDSGGNRRNMKSLDYITELTREYQTNIRQPLVTQLQNVVQQIIIRELVHENEHQNKKGDKYENDDDTSVSDDVFSWKLSGPILERMIVKLQTLHPVVVVDVTKLRKLLVVDNDNNDNNNNNKHAMYELLRHVRRNKTTTTTTNNNKNGTIFRYHPEALVTTTSLEDTEKQRKILIEYRR